MVSILLSYYINMDTFDVSDCFHIFSLKKKHHTVIYKICSQPGYSVFTASAAFLIFEKLLMQTAAGASFLCHGWKNLYLTSFGILFHLQLNLTQVVVTFFFITWPFLKITFSGWSVKDLKSQVLPCAEGGFNLLEVWYSFLLNNPYLPGFRGLEQHLFRVCLFKGNLKVTSTGVLHFKISGLPVTLWSTMERWSIEMISEI